MSSPIAARIQTYTTTIAPILRFVMDLPGEKKHMDIPKWLYDLTGGDGKSYKVSYGRGYCPDYGNAELIAAHARAYFLRSDRMRPQLET